jgi:hypothetical protein
MPLIKCPDCQNDVSTSAAACPKCGAPVSSRVLGTPVATVEQTSKRLKGQIAISAVIFWVGVTWMIGSCQAHKETGPDAIAIILVFIGTIWQIVTRIRIWWHHK